MPAFIETACAISEALANDKVEDFNGQVSKLATALAGIEKDYASPHDWSSLVQPVLAVGKLQPAKELADARKQFLPFSTAVVNLSKQLRREDKAFRTLKVYHCPMAPEPGLWIQAKGPLANPFYGSKMLRCGEEVAL